MSKTKLLTILVIILLIINIITLSFFFIKAPRNHHPRDFRPKGPSEVIIDRLHFDKNQIAQFNNLIEAHQLKIISFDEKINNVKIELYFQLSKPENKYLTDSLLTILAATQKQIEEAHLQHFKEVKNLCRPNQIEDYNKLTNDLGDLFNPKRRDKERERKE